jgi:hypothetical protein
MDTDAPPPQDHSKWDAQAMGHVMGGLDPEESSAFRRHLLGCTHCKAHVRELRDLAGSLQMAARDEQSMQAIRTAARTAADDADEEVTPEPVRISGRVLAVIVATAVAIGILVFSNMSLRARTEASEARATEQGTTLAALGQGLVITDVTMSGQTSGVVVSDGYRVAWSLSGLPRATETEWLAVWLVTDGVAELVSSHGPDDGAPGLLSGSVSDDAASELVVTRTSTDQLVSPVPDGGPVPGSVHVRADLSLVRAGATADAAATGSDATTDAADDQG